MKNQFKLLKKSATFFATCIFVSLFLSFNIQAQVVFPNVQVSDVDNVEASPEGYKSIAVLEDTVYVVWTDKRFNDTPNVFFSKSIDGGQSFSTDIHVFNGPDSIGHVYASIAVDDMGVIYIAWTAISNNELFWNIWFTKSLDGGTTFQTPQIITNSNGSALPSISTYNNNVYIFYADLTVYPCANYYFVSSANGGASFETPVQINDVPCVSDVSDFTAVMTIDASGNIYLAWVDGRRVNSHGDICFAKSTNSGISFSSSIIVNDVSSPYADSVQYKPNIAVGGPNKVYISFTDSRLGADDWINNRAYLSISNDGGNSFAPEVLVADYNGICKFHDIVASPNDKLGITLCSNIEPFGVNVWLFESADGGNSFEEPIALSDTMNAGCSDLKTFMTPDENIYAIWKDERNGMGNNNVYFERTNHTSRIIENNPVDAVSVYPNPSDGLFVVDFEKDFTDVKLSIKNVQGQIIYKQHFDKTNKITFDLNLSTGIYFITIHSNEITKTVKLIKK